MLGYMHAIGNNNGWGIMHGYEFILWGYTAVASGLVSLTDASPAHMTRFMVFPALKILSNLPKASTDALMA